LICLGREWLEAEINMALEQCDIEYNLNGKTALGVCFEAGSLRGLQFLINKVPSLMSPDKQGTSVHNELGGILARCSAGGGTPAHKAFFETVCRSCLRTQPCLVHDILETTGGKGYWAEVRDPRLTRGSMV
jgi:hypothetical protein